MGRRSVRVDEPDRWVFNRLATAYRSRPPYPDELIDRLSELAIPSVPQRIDGLAEPAIPSVRPERSPQGCCRRALAGAPAAIVDLGAGMGHLSLPLAERGAIVTAVEPARAMLDVLCERVTAALAGCVVPIHAASEVTGLAARSFDLVLVADALHWIDPERAGAEAARLVRSGGTVAVVEASFAATSFMSGLAALLARANPKAQPRPPGALDQFLALAVGRPREAAAPRVERFVQEHPLDDDGLDALLRSMSHVGPALGPVALQQLLGEVRRLAEATGGARFVRDLTLTWSRVRADRGS